MVEFEFEFEVGLGRGLEPEEFEEFEEFEFDVLLLVPAELLDAVVDVLLLSDLAGVLSLPPLSVLVSGLVLAPASVAAAPARESVR